TPGTLAGTLVFETSSISHSDTSPGKADSHQRSAVSKYKFNRQRSSISVASRGSFNQPVSFVRGATTPRRSVARKIGGGGGRVNFLPALAWCIRIITPTGVRTTCLVGSESEPRATRDFAPVEQRISPSTVPRRVPRGSATPLRRVGQPCATRRSHEREPLPD